MEQAHTQGKVKKPKNSVRKTGAQNVLGSKKNYQRQFFIILIYIQNKNNKKKVQVSLYMDKEYNVKGWFNSFFSNEDYW